MNILEQTEALKDLPDAVLIQQMKMPTGEIAPIFITSELKRRKRMRDEYARREAADTPTVAEEVVMAAGMPSGGIADAARALAPKTDMGQNTGMGDMMPRTATQAPQPMASGGIVGMRQGGKLVKVGRASFYAFPDGEVFFEKPDGSREAVTDPRVLGVVRTQANVGPERQDESAAPLGSEILQEAAPEAPTLESTLSSARPFSPTSTEATDTRPAVPSSLGMGGERPTIVTSPAQPSFSPELDGQGIASIATSSTKVDPFGVAQSLLPPPETDVSSMVAPPTGENAVSTAGTDKLEAAIAAAQSAIDIDKTTPITLTMQQVQQAIAEGNSDILELAQQQGLLDEAIATMPAARSPKETKPLIDAGTDPVFGDTMGLQEVLASDFDPVSDASSKPATSYVPFIPIEPRIGERSIGVEPTGFIDDDIAPSDPADIKKKNFLASAADYFGFKPNEDSLAGRDPAQAKINELKAIIDGDADPEVKARAATELLELQNRLAVTRTGGNVSATAEGNEITVPEEYTIGPFGPVVDPNYQTPGKTGFSIVDQAAVQSTDDLNMLREAGIFPEATIDKATPIAELADYESSILPINRDIMDVNNALNNPYLSPADKNTLTDRVKELEKQKDDIAKTIGGSASTLFTPPTSGQEVGGFESLIDVNTPTAAGQPRYDVDQLPGPIGAGTAADPVVLSEKEAVGIEAARPKAAPVALKAERDAAKLSAPDGGGITTVSTKAINDAAKSTGLGVDAWLAIAKGGAAMAASKNPTLLGAFGEGAGVAASSLMAQRASEKKLAQDQAKIDATLEAARIRAAAAGKGSKLAATGSTLYPAIVGQLEQKELELATETSKGKGSSAAKIDSLTKEIESLKQRKRQIETASGLLVAAGGGGDTKNYDVS